MVEIVLTEAQYDCLRQTVSRMSPVAGALRNAVMLTGSARAPAHALVRCDLDDAEILLSAAERWCQAAVGPIKLAIRVSSRTAVG